MKRNGLGTCLGLSLFLCCLIPAARAQTEIVQSGGIRVSLTGSLAPRSLPRSGSAPISVNLSGRISSPDGSPPPPLQRLEIEINRNGHLDPGALPTCRVSDVQPATTENALRACGSARVGTGTFSAAVSIPGQAPFPSQGQVTLFNGVDGGRPAILLHVYGSQPVPTSFTVPLRIGHGSGSFGLVLDGRLPSVSANVGYVKGLTIELDGRAGRGRRHYLSAGCPAPRGFSRVLFPLARTRFSFAGGKAVTATLTRICKAIG